MNRYTAACITIAALLSAGSPAMEAASKVSLTEIAPYTGPERTPAAAPAIHWLADGTSYAEISPDHRSIIKRDIATGNETGTLLSLDNTREGTIDYIDGFTMSPNGRTIMVWTGKQSIYRRSYSAQYWIYDIHSRVLRPLSENHPRQQCPLYSPDGLSVAFVAPDNNIYLKKLTYWTEVAVTEDGAKGQVINGVPDWSYEEEFTTSCSMTWSPDSRTLCYLRYDESAVPWYSLTLYEGTCQPMPQYELYPGQMTYKYPVAGKPNSTVTLHSYSVENRKSTPVTLPDRRIEYIPRIAYAHSDDRLMVVTLNRAQTRMEIYAVNPRSTVAKSVLAEEHSAWINPITYEEVSWEPDGFTIISGRTGYDHIYRYSYAGALQRQVTNGNYDVTAYYGRDQRTGAVYYQSTSSGAINRVVSRIDTKGKVTDLTPANGNGAANFAPDMGWYTLTYSNATTPPVTRLHKGADGRERRVLIDNTKGDYATRYASAPKREFFTMTSGDVTLNGYIIKPAGFDASKRYPAIMYQYSGPGSQEVLDRWQVNWATYAAIHGYVVVCVDGRGTGGRGRKFMDVVYRNLGHYETIDQLAAARHAASLPYVDPTRIGMHGWSFGGYETLMAVSDRQSPYAAAVAVAPVTDWRFYDTIYTERYMLTPGENADGYHESSPLWRTSQVKCPLLIMHGTLDDNVHPANTIQYLSQMESEGNYCDLLLFPNMNHSINGCGVQSLVYARMLDYFDNHLKR